MKLKTLLIVGLISGLIFMVGCEQRDSQAGYGEQGGMTREQVKERIDELQAKLDEMQEKYKELKTQNTDAQSDEMEDMIGDMKAQLDIMAVYFSEGWDGVTSGMQETLNAITNAYQTSDYLPEDKRLENVTSDSQSADSKDMKESADKMTASGSGAKTGTDKTGTQ